MKPGSKGGESWAVSFFKDATKASPAKQLTIGGISGWCVGFVFTKAGKIAATAIGGSLLLFQIAQHQGYVKVNWSRLNKDLQQAQNELARRTDGKLPRLLEEACRIGKMSFPGPILPRRGGAVIKIPNYCASVPGFDPDHRRPSFDGGEKKRPRSLSRTMSSWPLALRAASCWVWRPPEADLLRLALVSSIAVLGFTPSVQGLTQSYFSLQEGLFSDHLGLGAMQYNLEKW